MTWIYLQESEVDSFSGIGYNTYMSEYICHICKKEFISYNPSPKFCSRHCKGLNQRLELPIIATISLYQKGNTIKEISQIYSVSYKAVRNLLIRHSVNLRKACKRDQKREKNDNWNGNGS